MRKNPKVVILGMGNLLLRDEGIGVHVANALQEAPSPGNIELEIIDGATSPDATLAFQDADKLIVVDAVQAGDEPGAIYRFYPADINLDDNSMTSVHQISLLDNLRLMEIFGQKYQDVVIIGVQPKETGWGIELSTELQQRMSQIIGVVLQEAGQCHPDDPEKGE